MTVWLSLWSRLFPPAQATYLPTKTAGQCAHTIAPSPLISNIPWSSPPACPYCLRPIAKGGFLVRAILTGGRLQDKVQDRGSSLSRPTCFEGLCALPFQRPFLRNPFVRKTDLESCSGLRFFSLR